MTEINEMNLYKVLARKYRPETFKDLVGQAAMVQTLQNAFEADRIAQAFILTGIRGTGKTTTARIIAKGLNCIGLDQKGGPTIEPCGKCSNCTAIIKGNHVDVMEMDAASRTGVDDIREIIDNVKYKPVIGDYKIFIIDEVHMLSKSAFNALLKTLEEPPEHVKFIFATTEIKKVPITVLSRCQRFDLHRIENKILSDHLLKISKLENIDIDLDAISLIVRSADGSVRDGLSILDQSIAFSGKHISEDQVKEMIGLNDPTKILQLIKFITAGQTQQSLEK